MSRRIVHIKQVVTTYIKVVNNCSATDLAKAKMESIF